jgi:CDP-diacylglycerol--glycerol-3-phosphate 3-phosphatidyltransferase
MERITLTLPNILGLTRFVIGFVLLALAWFGYKNIFIGALCFAFLLDAIDGPIARYFHMTSAQGARLDSIADFNIYISLLISLFILWPNIVEEEFIFIVLAILAIITPAIIGLIKFKNTTSYHTWLVKISSVFFAPSIILLLLGGPSWPFRFAIVIGLLASLEEIIITLLLDKPRSDVKHIFAVISNRNESKDTLI